MKSIAIEELNKYVNPLTVRSDPAILVATDGRETNGLTIGWASFGTLWHKYSASVYIHKSRYSKHIFDNAEYFAICFFDDKYKDKLKYFGTVSGKDEDKMVNGGLTVETGEAAPYFAESRVVVLCKKMGQCDFNAESCDETVWDWYHKDGVHTQYMGEIVKILVAETL